MKIKNIAILALSLLFAFGLSLVFSAFRCGRTHHYHFCICDIPHFLADKGLLLWCLCRLYRHDCSIDVSPYYSSAIVGLERVGDHLVNVGYSIVNPIGSQTQP